MHVFLEKGNGPNLSALADWVRLCSWLTAVGDSVTTVQSAPSCDGHTYLLVT